MSDLFGNPEDWFALDAAQLLSVPTCKKQICQATQRKRPYRECRVQGTIISLEVKKEVKKSSGCNFTDQPITRDCSGPGVYGFNGTRIITACGCGAEFTVCFIGNIMFRVYSMINLYVSR